MTTKSENLSTPASFQQDFEFATVAYCGLLIQENLPASERENHKLETLLDCLRILSERDVVQASFGEYNPLSLKDYIRDLRRQWPCEISSEAVSKKPSTGCYRQEGKFLSEPWVLDKIIY
ncbi:uncharacterized protein RAG0_17552 [Rhynchosporium agropyri]|uniref:Uncharacterized protein n=1 Tax=Rhynchosporium agropyri TaxID=914238 RepID=A0A1E1LTW6_9HELO|nr:uncharacterized protein RAG0_17552 [Rhynchosporium agropyri]